VEQFEKAPRHLQLNPSQQIVRLDAALPKLALASIVLEEYPRQELAHLRLQWMPYCFDTHMKVRQMMAAIIFVEKCN
jgi:hypothetical protein